MLTEAHKQSRLQICSALKEHFDREGENVFAPDHNE
jgi:hypothetical protein